MKSASTMSALVSLRWWKERSDSETDVTSSTLNTRIYRINLKMLA